MDDHLFFPRGSEENNPKILSHIALPFVNAIGHLNSECGMRNAEQKDLATPLPPLRADI